jgi:hypothetical protein
VLVCIPKIHRHGTEFRSVVRPLRLREFAQSLIVFNLRKRHGIGLGSPEDKVHCADAGCSGCGGADGSLRIVHSFLGLGGSAGGFGTRKGSPRKTKGSLGVVSCPWEGSVYVPGASLGIVHGSLNPGEDVWIVVDGDADPHGKGPRTVDGVPYVLDGKPDRFEGSLGAPDCIPGSADGMRVSDMDVEDLFSGRTAQTKTRRANAYVCADRNNRHGPSYSAGNRGAPMGFTDHRPRAAKAYCTIDRSFFDRTCGIDEGLFLTET